jgi:hypothetical protein
MTWTDYAIARQQQVEERIGTRVREAAEREKALARKSAEQIAKRERHGTR